MFYGLICFAEFLSFYCHFHNFQVKVSVNFLTPALLRLGKLSMLSNTALLLEHEILPASNFDTKISLADSNSTDCFVIWSAGCKTGKSSSNSSAITDFSISDFSNGLVSVSSMMSSCSSSTHALISYTQKSTNSRVHVFVERMIRNEKLKNKILQSGTLN